jgi:hypothetical protein
MDSLPHIPEDVSGRKPTIPSPSTTSGNAKSFETGSDARADGDWPLDSVWNEPTMAGRVASDGGEAVASFARWLAEGRSRFGLARSWLATLGLGLAAGPLAVISAFWGAGQTLISVLAITVFGPLVEELGKIMAALVTVERRPFVFRNPWQILFCCVAGGAVFAVIENLLYLHVRAGTPSPELIYWRWTVCTGLHIGCSLIAGWGVVRVWQDVWRRQGPAQVEVGYPYWITAIVIHGAYNAFALIFESLLSPF